MLGIPQTIGTWARLSVYCYVTCPAAVLPAKQHTTINPPCLLSPNLATSLPPSLVTLNIAAVHRLQPRTAAQVPLWCRIGRLKRNRFPFLGGSGGTYGGGAGPGVLAAVCGRLLGDTYLAARELIREVEFTLSHLAKVQLGQRRHEQPLDDLATAFASP